MPCGAAAGKVVLLIKNIFSSTLYGVGSRLLSDALPSHIAQHFSHHTSGTTYHTAIEGGAGSAPSLALSIDTDTTWQLPEAFKAFFPSWSRPSTASRCKTQRCAPWLTRPSLHTRVLTLARCALILPRTPQTYALTESQVNNHAGPI